MPWFSKKAPRVESKTVVLTLTHRNGHAVTINASEEMYKFLRNNLGRDEIYAQDKIILNLKDFFLIELT